jgi:hypothetical protein
VSCEKRAIWGAVEKLAMAQQFTWSEAKTPI